MRLRDWREVIFEDWPAVRVTKGAIENAVGCARRYFTADARLAMGRVYTDAEYEARRLRILSKPLP